MNIKLLVNQIAKIPTTTRNVNSLVLSSSFARSHNISFLFLSLLLSLSSSPPPPPPPGEAEEEEEDDEWRAAPPAAAVEGAADDGVAEVPCGLQSLSTFSTWACD